MASTFGILTSSTSDDTNFQAAGDKNQQKLVKNFNEFLNFTSLNKSRISEKVKQPNESQRDLSPTSPLYSINLQPQPLLQLTKGESSFDESDSSIADVNWSNSTAPTALQNNIEGSQSSINLQLHLNSKSGTVHSLTPSPLTNNTLPSVDQHSKNNIDPNITPDDSQDQEYYPMSTAMTRELRLEMENLDRQVFGDSDGFDDTIRDSMDMPENSEIEYEKLSKDSMDLVEDLKENEIISCPDVSELIVRRRERNAKARSLEISKRFSSCSSKMADIYNWENQLHYKSNQNSTFNCSEIAKTIDVQKVNPVIETVVVSSTDSMNPFITNIFSEAIEPELPHTELLVPSADGGTTTTVAEEVTFAKSNASCNSLSNCTRLPPPNEFGGGNPFLMFLCLTLLLQHRNIIMKSNMDYNEIAMHFDKMVRKHDVTRVLNQARRMYVDYLKNQNASNANDRNTSNENMSQHQQQETNSTKS